MDIFEPKKVVFTSHSKYFFYFRMLICKYVLERDYIPLNPFNVWGYFVYELVDRALVRRGNYNIIRAADELWVFGPITDGVLTEIEYAMKMKKPIKFFTVGNKYEDISPLGINDLIFEKGASAGKTKEDLTEMLKSYISTIGEK